MYQFIASNTYVFTIAIQLVTFVFLFVRLVRMKGFGKQEAWIVKLVMAGIVCSVTDAMCVALQGSVNRFGFWLLNAVFNLSFGFVGYILFSYTQSNYYEISKRQKLIYATPLGIMIFLMIASYWTGWVFYVDANVFYCRGPLYYFTILFLILGYIVLAVAYSIYKYCKSRERKDLLPVLYVAPYILGVFVQLVFPFFPFGNAGLTFMMILVYVYNMDRLYIEVHNKELVERQGNREKSLFLSRMSHDLRTPINGISGLIEISEAHLDDPELIKENLRKSRIATRHLLSLLNNVLEMSKIESGKINLLHEPMNIEEIAKQIITVAQMRAEERDITIYNSFDLMAPYKHMLGSEPHIRMLFVNLLDNAIKYGKPGGYVKISDEIVSVNGDIVTIRTTIEDNGRGMSKEYLAHIYESFSQEKLDNTGAEKGVGLGMSIVKAIVDSMDGTIDIRSEENVGTTVTVTLNYHINPNPVEELEEGKKNIDGMKVLLVEDNELNMEIATFMLEEEGAIVTKAFDGQEAVDIYLSAADGAFDVILMDIMMPVMNGYDATHAIRSSNKEDARNIPIVAISANAFSEDILKSKEAGMTEHLAKPIAKDKMITIVAKYK